MQASSLVDMCVSAQESVILWEHIFFHNRNKTSLKCCGLSDINNDYILSICSTFCKNATTDTQTLIQLP